MSPHQYDGAHAATELLEEEDDNLPPMTPTELVLHLIAHLFAWGLLFAIGSVAFDWIRDEVLR